MITLDIEQGSPEWIQARLGVVSASDMSKIITPEGKKAVSTSWNDLMNRLIAESYSGRSDAGFTSQDMDNGKEWEDDARNYLAFDLNQQIDQVGFIYKDENKKVGCSPDGLIGENAGVEIKCPRGSTHVSYLLRGKLPTAYKPQVQASLWITQREYWYFLSYYDGLEPLLLKLERDEDYIMKMQSYVADFIGKMHDKRIKIENI